MSEIRTNNLGQIIRVACDNMAHAVGECLQNIAAGAAEFKAGAQALLRRYQAAKAADDALLNATFPQDHQRLQKGMGDITPTTVLKQNSSKSASVPGMSLDDQKLQFLRSLEPYNVRPEQEKALAGRVAQLLNAPDAEALQQAEEALTRFAAAENTMAYAEAFTSAAKESCKAMNFTDTEIVSLPNGSSVLYGEREDGVALAVTLHQTPESLPVLAVETLNVTDDTCHELVEEFTARMQRKVVIHQPGRREATGGIAILPATKQVQERNHRDRAAQTERDERRQQEKEQQRRRHQMQRRAGTRRAR